MVGAGGAQDWENTLYNILVTLIVVIALDMLSGRLRRRLLVKTRPAGTLNRR